MDREDWAAAARDFQRATDIDRTFEDAYYGLGLAKVRLKHYGEAVVAYVKCRDLYRAHAGRRFAPRCATGRRRSGKDSGAGGAAAPIRTFGVNEKS